MKKIIYILIVLIAIPFVFAQDEDKAGVTPDSPFYGLDVALDNFRMVVKPESSVDVAEERVFEVKKMLESGKINEAARAEIERSKAIAIAEKSVGKERALEAMQKHIEVLRNVETKLLNEDAKAAVSSALTNSMAKIEERKARFINE